MPQTLTPDEPALYLTVQATLPRLTTSMFAFSLAAIGFLAKGGWEDQSVPLLWFTLSTHQVSFACFGLAVICFHLATEGCVKSHAWDYEALSKDRRASEGISDDAHYKERCRVKLEKVFRRTVWAYRFGFFFVMIGCSVLFASYSSVTAAAIALYAFFQILRWGRAEILVWSHRRIHR